ncbi:MAG TPA: SDR family NAD(P)-dependent oxidoreductase [Anaeromyxobacter sp.]|nr:SDR family NAD(P)-dependent oxidoreductase [Anaeromyxobacter sp.]
MSDIGAALTGKTCVVTGAARSIGLAIAEAYRDAGAKVAMLDLNPEVTAQAERLAKSGAAVRGFVVDITDRGAVLEAFGRIAAELGDPYALVNNAGIVDQRPIEETTPELLDRVFRVNVHGAIYCIQGVLAGMRKRHDGKIISFSSKSGKTGSALMAPYSAAKGAVISLTQALAHELAPDNIKVNCICPGITDATGVWSAVSKGYTENLKLPREQVVKQFTAKVPLGRLTDVRDLVDFVLFLTASGEYCTGQAFNVTGGREMH